ncbi:hypothetical protein HNW13_017695 [Shewanella sp. BF02_Schw]|uniref:hypothetical protein n=1 Tax=Shewanella sp. BF02_Schw TaxID=394908 RepID=UPI001782A7E7|nr:hypothetical protein [Shewanella sp. BF02_Schw]MBO1897573.1 hypothetical protein [Shewanella sp. BF02_Schw]
MEIDQNKKVFGDIEETTTMLSNLITQPTNEVDPEICSDEAEAADEERKQLEENIIKRTMQRRDRIVYLALSGIRVNEPTILAEIATDFETSISIVKQDIHALCCKETWKKHKHRLKALLLKAKHLKLIQAENRKKEVAATVLSFVKINESMLVDFSLRYDCMPKTLMRDITQLKSANYWYANYMKKRPVKQQAKAAIIFMRMHITY